MLVLKGRIRESLHVKGLVGFLKKEEVGFTYLKDVLSCFFAGMNMIKHVVCVCVSVNLNSLANWNLATSFTSPCTATLCSLSLFLSLLLEKTCVGCLVDEFGLIFVIMFWMEYF